MDERLRFVARLLDGDAMSDVCRAFGISRKIGYKIFDRYKEHGFEALSDRSRRPVRYANQLPPQVEQLIVADTDPEGEPSLGPPEASVIIPQWPRTSADDREQDDEHGGDVLDQSEKTLGWANNISQVTLGHNKADGDLTAPERHGMGFVWCGAEDAEDDGTAEPI